MAPHNIRVTVISPGAVRTELHDHISEKDIQQANRDFAAEVAIPAETFGRLVAFAINEPEDVGINEILFRPTAQEL
jgi:NADP-dependent 3-hydroxy acid dehydrogenase YdfG